MLPLFPSQLAGWDWSFYISDVHYAASAPITAHPEARESALPNEIMLCELNLNNKPRVTAKFLRIHLAGRSKPLFCRPAGTGDLARAEFAYKM